MARKTGVDGMVNKGDVTGDGCSVDEQYVVNKGDVTGDGYLADEQNHNSVDERGCDAMATENEDHVRRLEAPRQPTAQERAINRTTHISTSHGAGCA